MTTEQMKSALNPASFRPFTIRTADGREFHISHPESALLSSGGRTVAIATPQDTIEIVDLLLVTSLSVGASRPKRRKAS